MSSGSSGSNGGLLLAILLTVAGAEQKKIRNDLFRIRSFKPFRNLDPTLKLSTVKMQYYAEVNGKWQHLFCREATPSYSCTQLCQTWVVPHPNLQINQIYGQPTGDVKFLKTKSNHSLLIRKACYSPVCTFLMSTLVFYLPYLPTGQLQIRNDSKERIRPGTKIPGSRYTNLL